MSNKKDIEEDIKFIKTMIEEYKTFKDLDNPEFENTDKIYKALENILADRERLEKENERLSNYRYENGYCIENTNLITKDKIVSIQKNTYKIEIEDNVFVDVKALYVKANKYDNLVKEIEEQCKRDIEQARKEYKITLNDRQDGIREEAQNILELLDKEKEKI